MPVLTAIQSFLAAIGAASLGLCRATGGLAIFAAASTSHILRPPWYPAEFGRQLLRIGWFSLPVVGLTTLFTGGALALQIYSGGARFNAESVVPSIVAIGMVRELGPVLGGLMVAGRVSASIAAELATMRVTEQIDALEALAVDSFKYLASTRVIACMIGQPILTTVFNFMAISGGFLAETFLSGISFELYFERAFQSITFIDYIPSTLKTIVFGFLIASISGYLGYNARGGAEGVGRASTQSVVASSIVLIIVNVVLVRAIFFLFPGAR